MDPDLAHLAVAVCGAGLGLGTWLVLTKDIGSSRGSGRRLHEAVTGWTAGLRRARRRVVAALGTGIVVWVVVGWPAAGVLTAVGVVFLPGLVGPDRGHAARVARIEAIASWVEMLRDTLSAAAGLEQALLVTAPIAPAPIRAEVGELGDRLRRGERLTVALPALAARLGDQTADLVVAALLVAARHQARDLAALLGALAASAREQAGMRLRVAAARARIRTSVRMVVATTATLAVVLVVLNRGYLAPYDTAVGQLVLLGVGGLFAIGFGWLARTARFTEPTGLLLDHGHDSVGVQ